MKRQLLLLAAVAALLVWALPASAGDILGFTEEVSPDAETNATEPYIAIDHTDGTVWVAWQASGTHVARSDDGGRTFVQTPIVDLFGSVVGDVDIAVGGPTPCGIPTSDCLPGTHRVYVTSLEKLPLPLQTHLAYSDDRGAHWTIDDIAATNPSLIDRPWLAVDPSAVSAAQDKVYIAYHDFSVSQISVAASTDGGTVSGRASTSLPPTHALRRARSATASRAGSKSTPALMTCTCSGSRPGSSRTRQADATSPRP